VVIAFKRETKKTTQDRHALLSPKTSMTPENIHYCISTICLERRHQQRRSSSAKQARLQNSKHNLWQVSEVKKKTSGKKNTAQHKGSTEMYFPTGNKKKIRRVITKHISGTPIYFLCAHITHLPLDSTIKLTKIILFLPHYKNKKQQQQTL
jgi:hypothetical protein